MNERLNDDLTDAVLIKRAKRGDYQAFGILYERYVGVIFRYIRTRVADTQTAEDLTESVFLRSFEAIRSYRERGLRYSAYLYQVARNLLVDHYRKGEEEVSLESVEHRLESQQSTLQETARREQVEILKVAMDRLPEEYQEVIRVRVLLEIPTAEAALWMQRSEGATRVLLHRALKALKREVADGHDPRE